MTLTPTSEENLKEQQPAYHALDHSRLLSMVEGDEDLLRGICGLFLRACPEYLSAIRESIALGESDALRRAAHTLKGSGGHFLTATALEALVDLEAIAVGGNLNSAPERFAALEGEMESLKHELSLLAGENF